MRQIVRYFVNWAPGTLVVTHRPKKIVAQTQTTMHHAQVVMAIMKRTGCGNTVSTLGPKVPGSGRVLSQARYLLPAPLQVTDNTTKVISMMVKDSVYRAAVNDEVRDG